MSRAESSGERRTERQLRDNLKPLGMVEITNNLIKKWPKTSADISPKKIQRWQISIWKDVPHHVASGKCKLKQQWQSTTHIRMAKIQNTDNIKCWLGCEAVETLIHCWWECKMVQRLWKTVWLFLTKLNIIFSCDPAIERLGVYLPKGVENLWPHKNLHKDVYTSFYI